MNELVEEGLRDLRSTAALTNDNCHFINSKQGL